MGSVNTLGEPTPFEPPLTLSRGVVSWLNEIAAPRMVLESRLGDKPLSMRMNRLVWQADRSAVSMLDCVFRVGDETAVLSLPRSLVETLISTVQHGLNLPSDPTRSLLLELALEPWIARLENLLAQDLQLARMDEATTEGPYLQLDIAYGPLTGKGRLFLFSSLDGPVPPAFGALGALIGQLPREMRKLSPELPVMVAREIGSLRVSVALLRQAQAGDALLPDVVPYARDQVILTADKLWAPALVASDRLILQGPFRLQPHPLKCAYMTPRSQLQQPIPPSESDIDSIEITLVFECGRWPVPLGTLRRANEGHVFELGRPLDGPVDIIANGRLIGRGDIVRVGEELAIRLRGRLAVND
ncbi:type III secretion system cytoplasmic ring protein SctQ [Bradyrhizobium neotropicale]|uniref:type III secretion system cytoplasmic ring protein SctQ n=1 Tax=Bradyrhizobium neotropicale TaxID=1497615 RepID=UPI001AD76D53|nr:type III secretion system cytoplasmic ring protein SctQ [Bradyrhizobium neotropicale]MBO4227528.1 YscQ/HrcQ family type III secretion apparatus protein [Bradyrhizobium neotropicale]